MAEVTVSAVAAAVLPAHAPAWDGARGEHHQNYRRRPARRAAPRLLEAIVPGRTADQVEVMFEYNGHEFHGVSFRDRVSGEEICFLGTEELKARGEAPGLLLERQG
jgi:hypothetical protein